MTDQDRLLEAVERLFYARGVQAVGMDEVRAASGLSLKRIYQLYPGKDELVTAFLDRRDIRWRGSLTAYVEAVEDEDRRLLAVFDWLERWFGEPEFRGCAWINVHAELGATTPAVAAAARAHKEAFRRFLNGLVGDAGYPRKLADALFLLAEGAMVTASITGSPTAARQAREAAADLVVAYEL